MEKVRRCALILSSPLLRCSSDLRSPSRVFNTSSRVGQLNLSVRCADEQMVLPPPPAPRIGVEHSDHGEGFGCHPTGTGCREITT